MTSNSAPSVPLKLGFIGGGINSAIGPAHFTSSMLDGRFAVTSGCFSRDERINQETAQRWNIDPKACFTNWQEYLVTAESSIDALCILTPIPDHCDMLIAALDRGIPVICEKALVSNTQEASKMRTRYGDSPYFLAVTYNYSGYPAVRLLRELVENGKLGTIQQVHLEMPLENYTRIPVGQDEPARPQPWRQSDGVIPTLLLDLGVHLHHLLSFITGASAQKVMAQLNHFSTQPDIIDDARIWLECSDGLQANLWMSKTALGNRNGMRVRVFGDKGSAAWYQFNPEVLELTDVNGIRSEMDRGVENDILATPYYNRFKAGHPSGYIEAFSNLYWDIADALHSYKATRQMNHPYVFGLDHSIDGLATLEAAVEAHQNRCWVDVENGSAHSIQSTESNTRPGSMKGSMKAA